jgi:hypothetical protein
MLGVIFVARESIPTVKTVMAFVGSQVLLAFGHMPSFLLQLHFPRTRQILTGVMSPRFVMKFLNIGNQIDTFLAQAPFQRKAESSIRLFIIDLMLRASHLHRDRNTGSTPRTER